MVSAPSGAGKTTLCRRLLSRLEGVEFSVSYTTRAPRKGEVEGVDYHFVSETRFEEMVEAGRFLEWARVHGNFYGTGRDEVIASLEQGIDILLDIDVQGARKVRKLFPGAVFIFILPPSWKELEARLKGRGSEDQERVRLRLANARSELGSVHEYKYAVVNADLYRATEELEAIVLAQRCKISRVLSRPGLLKALRPPLP